MLLVAAWQGVGLRVVEEGVVAVPPGEGLAADPEVVVGDEAWPLPLLRQQEGTGVAEGNGRQAAEKEGLGTEVSPPWPPSSTGTRSGSPSGPTAPSSPGPTAPSAPSPYCSPRAACWLE